MAQVMVWRWRSRSYSSSDYFSSPLNKILLTYDIELIDESAAPGIKKLF